ncbi:Uncharacterised protein [Amycolatopsis camponoti]|uniref:Uncharacterized protein n=1 Tax=Amycolatopsis camponoti TaxID=2606593 RepID=A0A6I8LMK9_9PSEU|nr:Uncharacterised protein [Amycolatopsis camponoti]
MGREDTGRDHKSNSGNPCGRECSAACRTRDKDVCDPWPRHDRTGSGRRPGGCQSRFRVST